MKNINGFYSISIKKKNLSTYDKIILRKCSECSCDKDLEKNKKFLSTFYLMCLRYCFIGLICIAIILNKCISESDRCSILRLDNNVNSRILCDVIKDGLGARNMKKKIRKRTNDKQDNNDEEKSNYEDDERFIKYEIPDSLKNDNIECPYEYGDVFYGTRGIINYELKGNKNSKNVVITFHGLYGSNLEFYEIQQFLVKSNFQVLNFDLYGYGLSATPKYNDKEKTYGIDFYVEQTEELLKHLKLENKDYYLVGFSMGCIIAAGFTRKHTERVKKIVLISPVGILDEKPWYLKIFKKCSCLINLTTHILRPCCFRTFKKKRVNEYDDDEVVEVDIGDDNKNNDNDDNDIYQKNEFLYNRLMWHLFVKKDNVAQSILGCINNLHMWSAHHIYREVGKTGIPVLILGGKDDEYCSEEVFENTTRYFKNTHLIVFEDASHLVLLEETRKINMCTLLFFKSPNDVYLPELKKKFPVDRNGQYKT
ncbi:aminopeptidase,putative [Plasmodium sp. DRC-Itaito]|nr:aminopeptidase,putative [Plasmodium sp. DRC-Itaito]